MPHRVVVIDDHTLLCDGLAKIICDEPDMTIVGQAHDGQAGLELIEGQRPDVALIDAEMPGPALQVTIPQVRMVSPATTVVVLTGAPDAFAARALMAMGARGYVTKDVSAEQLVAAIRAVGHEDGRTVLASATQSLTHWLDRFESDHGSELTDREREVLELAAQDQSNLQIATALHLSESTVRRYLQSATQKLGANSRLGTVLRAVGAGLISPAVLVDPAAMLSGGRTGEGGVNNGHARAS